jgi:hypothetical protein
MSDQIELEKNCVQNILKKALKLGVDESEFVKLNCVRELGFKKEPKSSKKHIPLLFLIFLVIVCFNFHFIEMASLFKKILLRDPALKREKVSDFPISLTV